MVMSIMSAPKTVDDEHDAKSMQASKEEKQKQNQKTIDGPREVKPGKRTEEMKEREHTV